ncbi:hypothetical protein K443DRAFT_9063 [Laccaria amethystina LaAM-08-1]|uniref:Uncharacterized protein n=1 Tax=Laccaria amethystina LaAM-08-1 TaxID=1095629 RepID=A0A0C9XM06_9AGAR|nr:hypothetical protein K443DRAFT_9063 [Laccaria amethystina LaAM-08-1]
MQQFSDEQATDHGPGRCIMMLEISLQQIFTPVPTTVSWYTMFGLQILLKTLHALPDAAI